MRWGSRKSVAGFAVSTSDHCQPGWTWSVYTDSDLIRRYEKTIPLWLARGVCCKVFIGLSAQVVPYGRHVRAGFGRHSWTLQAKYLYVVVNDCIRAGRQSATGEWETPRITMYVPLKSLFQLRDQYGYGSHKKPKEEDRDAFDLLMLEWMLPIVDNGNGSISYVMS